MARKKGNPRGPATVQHLAHIEDKLNADLAQKTTQMIAAYHESMIGTPTSPTVEKRLYWAERTNPIWWLVSLFLWLKDQVHLQLILRWPERFAPEPVEPCDHPVEALAQTWDEPSVPCPRCGMLLALPAPNEAANAG